MYIIGEEYIYSSILIPQGMLIIFAELLLVDTEVGGAWWFSTLQTTQFLVFRSYNRKIVCIFAIMATHSVYC